MTIGSHHRTVRRLLLAVVGGCTLMLLPASPAQAQTPVPTAFTYQGFIRHLTVPITGTVEFEFSLWDDPTNPDPLLHQVGNTLVVSADAVDGLFTALLDFGEGSFTDEARWLQIAICYPIPAGGCTSFTPLDERQELTPTPFSLATRGLVVDPVGNVAVQGDVRTTAKVIASGYASNSPLILYAPDVPLTERARIDDLTGHFGIGTTSPEGRLHVADAADPDITLENSGDNTVYRRVSINFLHEFGTGTEIGAEIEARREAGVDDGMSLSFKTEPVGGGLAERMRITEAGDVGIGSASPDARLLVRGEAGETAFRVRVEGTTKLLVAGNGGVAIGQNFSSLPTDGLRVKGNVGIGTLPQHPLDVETSSGTSAVRVLHTATSGTVSAVESRTASTGGVGVLGLASNVNGIGAGVRGFTSSVNSQSAGVGGYASAASGTARAVLGVALSPNGYAGYFDGGRSYFSNNVGLGVLSPTFRLHLSTNSAAKPTSNTWTISSDARLKKNIGTIEHALNDLLALRGVTYQWIDPASQGGMDGTYTGLVAQEVERVFPEWISEAPDGYKQLTVIGFEGIVVEGLRELRAEKDAQIAEQQQRIDDLTDRLERLEKVIALPTYAKENTK